MNTRKILKEMIKNILKEEEMLGLSFETPLKENSISFYGLKKHFNLSPDTDIFENESKLTIYWDLDVDANNRGISNISPLVKSIKGFFNWEVSLEELPQEDLDKILKMGGSLGKYSITVESEFIYNSIQSDFEIKISYDNDYPTSFYPNLIEIDFDHNTIEINF